MAAVDLEYLEVLGIPDLQQPHWQRLNVNNVCTHSDDTVFTYIIRKKTISINDRTLDPQTTKKLQNENHQLRHNTS